MISFFIGFIKTRSSFQILNMSIKSPLPTKKKKIYGCLEFQRCVKFKYFLFSGNLFFFVTILQKILTTNSLIFSILFEPKISPEREYSVGVGFWSTEKRMAQYQDTYPKYEFIPTGAIGHGCMEVLKGSILSNFL